jgi:hypothetical protein
MPDRAVLHALTPNGVAGHQEVGDTCHPVQCTRSRTNGTRTAHVLECGNVGLPLVSWTATEIKALR